MESGGATEVEVAPDEAALNRSRSLKSKLLVRSQAIRESHSPPRTAPPSPRVSTPPPDPPLDPASRSDWPEKQDGDEEVPVQRVEIQITHGAWECGGGEDAARSREVAQPELLSNSPRVTCVCGTRQRLCLHCRGRRRYGGSCPAKQDSGIGCSQDCPECADSPEILVSPASEPSEHRRHRSRNKSESYEEGDICRCQEKKERIPKISSLTRTDSDEKRELTPQQLVRFIRDTLNKSQRDRLALLKIERELTALVNDAGRCNVRFPSVTSYGRMLIHRCAELFQLRHTLDHASKNTVLVSKTGTCGGRIPCTGFRQWCTSALSSSPQRQDEGTQAKSILKRSAHSLDEPLAGAAAGGAARSKSFEQREEEYERVRRRIFSSEDGDNPEQWPWLPSGPVKLLLPDSTAKGSRLQKVQSLEVQSGGEGEAARGAVSKSQSFGGYGGDEPQPRILSRQGDLASSSWRLSPSSSGYKTLSLRSTDSVTPSPTGGVSPEPGAAADGGGGGGGGGGGALVWAVSDLSSIPSGALIIHPQTGRPLTNPDGSTYHYDPARPPVLPTQSRDNQTEQNADKRRGKLEKQNSFIGPDCECQAEGYPSEKCCNCCETKSNADWSHTCYHTNHDTKKQHLPQQSDNNINMTDNLKNNALPPTAAEYESTNKDQPKTNQVAANVRPTNHSAEAVNRLTGLDYQTTNEEADSRRSLDESYQYATDYGPNVNSNIVHYSIPYYQSDQFKVSEEMTQPPQAVTSPGFAEAQLAQATQNKPLAVYDTTIRAQLSLGELVYSAGLHHNGFAYTNHCRTDGSMLQGQPTDPKSALAEQVYSEHGYYQPPHVTGAPYQSYPGVMGAGCPHHVGCAGACGVDPTSTMHCLAPARSGLTYGQASLADQSLCLPVVLPQHGVHQYQFPPNQWSSWQPLLPAMPPCAAKPPTPPVYLPPPDVFQYPKPELYPGVYPLLPYPGLYPQYVPQAAPNVQPVLPAYPVCHSMYGAAMAERADNRRGVRYPTPKWKYDQRGSGANSASTTPLLTTLEHAQPPTESKPAAESPRLSQASADGGRRRADGQLAERVAAMTVAERVTDPPPQQQRWQRHNSGGAAANYNATPQFNAGSAPPTPHSAQLSTAARTIVNSIQSMQSRPNASFQDNSRKRFDGPANFQRATNQSNQSNQSGQYKPSERTDARQNRHERRSDAADSADAQGFPDSIQNIRREVEGRKREQREQQEPRTDAHVNQRRSVSQVQPVQYQYGRQYMIRQMSTGAWCRRSPPAPPPPGRYAPRRPPPDTRRR